MANNICVLVYTCDRPEDIRRCLESVKKQDIGDFELLVVDNGRPQETAHILKSYNARVIKDAKKHLAYLFNLGWKNTDKELILYLADDVAIEPNWLSEAVNSLKYNPQAAIITGPLLSPFEFTGQMHYLYNQSQKNKALRLLSKAYNDFILDGRLFEPCYLAQSGGYSMGQGFSPDFKEEKEVSLATTSCMLIRRQSIEEIGGFDEHFMFNHADGDLFIRLREHGYKIVYNPNILAYHYNKFGPSRYPFFIGRDTAYFYLKDIRPGSIKGMLAALTNIIILNCYWVYNTIRAKDIRQLRGVSGFIKGCLDYIYRR